jgi:membrane-associated HD superfamily phosphohydrolase
MKKSISKMWKKRLLYYGLVAGFFCVMLWLVAKPYFGARYNYSIGDISGEDIISPKDITYINAKETEKRIDEVRKRVSVVFDFNASINLEVLKTIEMFFSAVRDVKSEDVSVDQRVARIKDKSSVDISKTLLGDVLKYQENGKFEERVINIVSFVLDTGLSDLKSAELKEYEENGIILKRIEEAEIILEKINTDQIIAADEAGRRINELILESYIDLPPAYRNTIGKTASIFLRPNVFFNSVETEKLKIEEIQKVRPVLNTIKKGAIVLRRGE